MVTFEEGRRKKVVGIAYSRDSGWSVKLPSPDDFFSQYLRTQASQLLPAAGSRPENASAAISAYEIFTRWVESRGKSRTNELSRGVPVTRSTLHTSILLPSFFS